MGDSLACDFLASCRTGIRRGKRARRSDIATQNHAMRCLERLCVYAGARLPSCRGAGIRLQFSNSRFSWSGSFLAGPWVSTQLLGLPSNATLNSERNSSLRRPAATRRLWPGAAPHPWTGNTTPRQHLARSMLYMTPADRLITCRQCTRYAASTRGGEPLRNTRMNRVASGSP